MSKIRVERIEVSADPGTMMDDCILEAVALACAEKRNVVLTFNDVRYEINTDEVLTLVETGKQTGKDKK